MKKNMFVNEMLAISAFLRGCLCSIGWHDNHWKGAERFCIYCNKRKSLGSGGGLDLHEGVRKILRR